MSARREAFDWLRDQMTPDEKAVDAANREVNEEARLADFENAKLFADVLMHGRGPELMEYLRNCTIEVPLMEVTGSLVRGEVALSPDHWAYLREGQNSIVRYMESRVRDAMKEPEPAPQQMEGESNG